MKFWKVKDKSYSMHLLPINSHTRIVLGAFTVHKAGDTGGIVNVPAITTNGRISFIPMGDPDSYVRTQDIIAQRMEERFPKEGYSNICTYVCAAVVLSDVDTEGKRNTDLAGFICEVWGFTEPMPELEQICRLLAEIGNNLDKDRSEVEKFFKSKPVKSYMNALIDFLKKEMSWDEYVNRAWELRTVRT